MALKTILIVWSISTFILAVSAIPYLIWLGIMAYRKQWRKVAKSALIPTAVYAIITLLAVVAGYWDQHTQYTRIFGVSCQLTDPVYSYDSERAFNGDGYSLAIYVLPDTVRKRFEHPDVELLNTFPKHSEIDRGHWSTEFWRQGPVDPRFSKYVHFALSSYDQQKNQPLMDAFAAIQNALARTDAYYAFFKYDHRDYPGDIDFFLVDLKTGRIYIINHNT
jgi:hypothetical protein